MTAGGTRQATATSRADATMRMSNAMVMGSSPPALTQDDEAGGSRKKEQVDFRKKVKAKRPFSGLLWGRDATRESKAFPERSPIMHHEPEIVRPVRAAMPERLVQAAVRAGL